LVTEKNRLKKIGCTTERGRKEMTAQDANRDRQPLSQEARAEGGGGRKKTIAGRVAVEEKSTEKKREDWESVPLNLRAW